QLICGVAGVGDTTARLSFMLHVLALEPDAAIANDAVALAIALNCSSDDPQTLLLQTLFVSAPVVHEAALAQLLATVKMTGDPDTAELYLYLAQRLSTDQLKNLLAHSDSLPVDIRIMLRAKCLKGLDADETLKLLQASKGHEETLVAAIGELASELSEQQL